MGNPASLPADFFSKQQNNPDTLPADFFSGGASSQGGPAPAMMQPKAPVQGQVPGMQKLGALPGAGGAPNAITARQKDFPELEASEDWKPGQGGDQRGFLQSAWDASLGGLYGGVKDYVAQRNARTVASGTPAGYENPLSQNPLSAPLVTSGQQAIGGNYSGATGTLAGAYGAPAVAAEVLPRVPGAARTLKTEAMRPGTGQILGGAAETALGAGLAAKGEYIGGLYTGRAGIRDLTRGWKARQASIAADRAQQELRRSYSEMPPAPDYLSGDEAIPPPLAEGPPHPDADPAFMQGGLANDKPQPPSYPGMKAAAVYGYSEDPNAPPESPVSSAPRYAYGEDPNAPEAPYEDDEAPQPPEPRTAPDLRKTYEQAAKQNFGQSFEDLPAHAQDFIKDAVAQDMEPPEQQAAPAPPKPTPEPQAQASRPKPNDAARNLANAMLESGSATPDQIVGNQPAEPVTPNAWNRQDFETSERSFKAPTVAAHLRDMLNNSGIFNADAINALEQMPPTSPEWQTFTKSSSRNLTGDMSPETHAQVISFLRQELLLNAVDKLDPHTATKGGVVSVNDLRQALPEMSKEDFDKSATELGKSGQLYLSGVDVTPNSPERAGMINGQYNAVGRSMRKPALPPTNVKTARKTKRSPRSEAPEPPTAQPSMDELYSRYFAKSDPADLVRNAYLDLSGGKFSTRVRLADLRERLPGMDRAQQDQVLLNMQRDDRLVLYPNDDPMDRTPRDEQAAIPLGDSPRELVYLHEEQPGQTAAAREEGKASPGSYDKPALPPTNVKTARKTKRSPRSEAPEPPTAQPSMNGRTER